jgi:hypothetical protein
LAENRGAKISIAPLFSASTKSAVSGAEAGMYGLDKRIAAFS